MDSQLRLAPEPVCPLLFPGVVILSSYTGSFGARTCCGLSRGHFLPFLLYTLQLASRGVLLWFGYGLSLPKFMLKFVLQHNSFEN